MIRIGDVYECDRCGARQFVNPLEFKRQPGSTEPATTEGILVDQYGWRRVWDDVHHCPKCKEEKNR